MAIQLRMVMGVAFAFLVPMSARATEVNIGHLEATDDSGIDWAHYSCEAKNNVPHCHIFQTLINHEVSSVDREKKIAEKVAAITPESFKAEMGQACDNISAIRAQVEVSLAAGKKPDGRAYSKQEIVDTRNQ